MRVAPNSDRYSPSPLRNYARSYTQENPSWENYILTILRRLPPVLNEQEIKRLREHKYASEGVTLLDPYMQKFWNWLVKLCPLWVAPNLITIIALIINIVTSVTLMVLSNNGKEQVSRIDASFKGEKKRFV